MGSEVTGAPAARIVAVVVTYRPDPQLIGRILDELSAQADVTVVVDNAAGEGLSAIQWSGRLEHLDLGLNEGVAAAQNAGIRRARELRATHVLLLDHDSLPGPGMAARLLHASLRLEASGTRVAAVGADCSDRRYGDRSPFVVMGATGFRRQAAGAEQAVPVAFVIASGSLIALDALDETGPMDERLFIDYVDVEWCLRARRHGRACFGVPGAALEHRLGDRPLTWRRGGRPVRWFGRSIPMRSPLRHYYLFRNGAWLIFHGTMPLRWKLLETKRLLTCLAAFVSFASPRHEQLAAIGRGILHGIRGALGPAR